MMQANMSTSGSRGKQSTVFVFAQAHALVLKHAMG